VTTTVSPPALGGPADLDDAATPGCPDRHGRTIWLGLLTLGLWALLCAGVLETPLWMSHDQMAHPALAVLTVLSKPVDVLFVLLVLLLVWCVSGRLWASMGALLALSATLSAVNVAKLSILQEPLYPSDYQFLNTPEFLLEMVTPGAVVSGVLGLGVVLAGTVAAARWSRHRYPRVTRASHPRGWAVLIGVRLVGVVVLALVIASARNFNDTGNGWRRLYDAQGATWQPFSQAMNYRSNGFIGGALYNLPGEVMPRPPDYSAATMRAVAERYAERAVVRNAGRTSGALADVNVVLVLSEAFADLTRVKGIELSRDTMPLTRETMSQSWSGSTLANMYGTGTSGMEFSALTGGSVGLFNRQVIAPYQNFMSGLSSYPSAVGWFRSHGHDAVAVHPYRPTMYKRNSVYPMLGFSSFIDDDEMQESDRLGKSKFISDRAAFDEVEHVLSTSEKPVLVNLVTMQNHLPTGDWYDDPVPVSTPDGHDAARELGGYARGQELTDGELRSFLDHLQRSQEKTVVVFYGDHYPGLFGADVLEQNAGLAMLETPMFIWSNRGGAPKQLPVTSPASFLPEVFDLVGEPLPPYYELLSEVAEQVGAIGRGRIVAPDGSQVSEDDLTPEQRQLLHDYRLVQYDFSVGERYAVDDMWYPFGATR
jgi:phosphoglycerol transferase MdoB-like AlkP superfamily enzyme